MGRLSGKCAVITGAALGIGRACAELFAGEGAKVAIADVLEQEGRKLAEQLNSGGASVEFWRLDVSEERQVERVMNEVVARFGGLDIVVNNAGISGASKPTHEITAAEWDQVMSVNVKGVFFCTKYAVPF
ncbi:MAG: SDR family NAD(P)-dependent oxidoreductase, partial [Gaiellaceae bacterium]